MTSTRLLLGHSIVNCLMISSVILTDRRTNRQTNVQTELLYHCHALRGCVMLVYGNNIVQTIRKAICDYKTGRIVITNYSIWSSDTSVDHMWDTGAYPSSGSSAGPILEISSRTDL